MSPSNAKIDVCIPTWNSGRTLARCLERILGEIAVNRIIIVDNFSGDDTVRIAEKFGAEMIQEKCGIGKARQILIENVTTEYFAFIDSDAVLRKGWFKTVIKIMQSNPRIGAVGGLFFSDNPHERRFWEMRYRRVRTDDPMWERGYLIDTLIRKEAVEGISIPEWLTNYEDKYIRDYLVSRNYRWVVSKDASCDHLVGERDFWKTVIGRRYFGAGLKFWKAVDPISGKQFFFNGLREPFVSSHAALQARDPLIIPYRLLAFFFTVIGYVGSSTRFFERIENDEDYKRRFFKFKRVRSIPTLNA